MKKLWGIIAILNLLLIFQTTKTVKASSGDYQIEKYHVQADVQKNGDVELTQRLNYQFDGDFKGVYYNQDIGGSNGVTDPQVSIKEGKKVKLLTASDSGQEDTFKVTKNNRLMKLKVYHSASNQNITFIYKYRLLGMVKNYQDTAELNWKIINDGWDKNLHNVVWTIQLPDKNVSQLQAWAHGPLDGYNNVDKKNGKVTLSIGLLPANTPMESHMIFPTSVTNDNPNIIKENRKDKILAQEKKLVADANASRKRKDDIYRGLMIFGTLIVILIFIVQFVNYYRHPANKHIIPTPLYHSFDEPKFLPSFTKVLLDRSDRADSLSLTADLLMEVSKRRMKIEKYGSTYAITALVPPTNDFFKYLINDIGDGKKVSLRQIKAVAESFESDKLRINFKKWSKSAAKGRKKYFDNENMNAVYNFKIAATANSVALVVMFFISIIFSRHILLTGIVALIVMAISWVLWLIAKKKITPYSDLGEQEINQIKAFRRMLKNIDDIKMAEVGDLILWEQFLPYAVVFGVSEKVIKALKVNFSAKDIENSMIIPFYFGANSFVNSGFSSFQSTFTNAISPGIGGSSSSSSGGSGGFTGGSSGGFGGGSGGAF